LNEARNKSLLVLFFRKEQESQLPSGEKESSFSEEKEAKRLYSW
jgi:hypothetical protein